MKYPVKILKRELQETNGFISTNKMILSKVDTHHITTIPHRSKQQRKAECRYLIRKFRAQKLELETAINNLLN